VLATAKHYIGDGGTTGGVDQGNTQITEAELLRHNLPPYRAAIAAGVRAVMVSFSSWQGTKMHAQRHLLTDVLKGELGFDGIVLSDWAGINQISGDYNVDVVTAINAGIDMVMVPDDFVKFIETLTSAVVRGDIPMTRIDDAVRRILRVKFEIGLFEHPSSRQGLADSIGSPAHRDLAREAVQQSLVLLKNDDQVLPLAHTAPLLLVAGAGADDIGLQSGGWTITQQGAPGDITPGTTILDGIRRTIDPRSRVEYDPLGRFEQLGANHDSSPLADVGIVVLAETPYAEGVGDRADLTLPPDDVSLLARVRPLVRKLVVVLLSGRPLVVTQQLPSWDAFVAAWLPGTEGQGVADVLFGDKPFTGHLPYTWPRWTNQLPFTGTPTPGCGGPLFFRGDGLRFGDPSPVQIDCQPP